MAIAKTGPFIGALSGNLAGANFANSRFGLTIRKQKPPPGPPTNAQLTFTRAFQLARSWWPLLTEEQRAAWRSFAANTLFRNRLGTQRNLTGQQLFIKHNFQSAILDFAWRPDPPTPWPFVWPTDFIPTVTAGVSAIIGPTPAHLLGGDPFIVAAARPLTTHPVNNFQRWAVIGFFITPAGGLIDCLPEIEARFGTLQSGERIGLRLRYIDIAMPVFGWLQHATTVI